MLDPCAVIGHVVYCHTYLTVVYQAHRVAATLQCQRAGGRRIALVVINDIATPGFDLPFERRGVKFTTVAPPRYHTDIVAVIGTALDKEYMTVIVGLHVRQCQLHFPGLALVGDCGAVRFRCLGAPVEMRGDIYAVDVTADSHALDRGGGGLGDTVVSYHLGFQGETGNISAAYGDGAVVGGSAGTD